MKAPESACQLSWGVTSQVVLAGNRFELHFDKTVFEVRVVLGGYFFCVSSADLSALAKSAALPLPQ
jgi:hypothetical protein